jgi:hypothetical protein
MSRVEDAVSLSQTVSTPINCCAMIKASRNSDEREDAAKGARARAAVHDKLCPLAKSVPIAAELLRKEREAVDEHARDDDASRKRFSSRNKRQVTSGMVSAARSVGVVWLMQLGLTAGFMVAPSMASFDLGALALARHISQYYELRARASPEPNMCDVYVHAVGSDKFWWVGKSCAREGVGGVDGAALAVVLQMQQVLEYAKILQPLELGQAEELEVWCAPLHG